MPDNPNRSLCDDFKIDLVAYLYEELDPERTEQIAQHLPDCSLCSGRINSLRESVASLLAATPPPPSTNSFAPIKAELVRDQRVARRKARLATWGRRGIAAAIAAMVMISLLRTPPEEMPVWAAPRLERKGVEVTVYNNNLGVVKDDRMMFNLRKGINEIKLHDVADLIDPTSVHFHSITDPVGTTVLEQNYEYDLASSSSVLNKYLGEPITVVWKNGKTISGSLTSFDNQQLVLGIADSDAIQMISRDRIRAIRFATLPEGLTARPTLVWKLDVEKEGQHDTRISYMTGGMSWEADYIMTLGENDRINLTGWVTLNNRSGSAYRDAKLKLIAGDIHGVQWGRWSDGPMIGFELSSLSAMADTGFQEKSFFEYHLYTLPRPTTLKENQTKQIELFPPIDQVQGKRLYEYHGQSDGRSVRVLMTINNAKANKLGIPLPAGRVRLLARDRDGEEQLVGIDRIDHTSRDEEFTIRLGNAFNLIGERTHRATRRLGQNAFEEDIEIKLRNHGTDDVTIHLIETARGDWTVRESNRNHEQLDANTLQFIVPVRSGTEETVTYTIRTDH